MLANQSGDTGHVGALDKNLHQPSTFFTELLELIGNELPTWRDRPDRRAEASETILTSQLCAHMNSVTRRAQGWDVLQFRTEEPDEEMRGRKVDLVAAPSDLTIWVEGRRYSDFDALFPIECKRLPTPVQSGRDEREYIFSKSSTTGGIQRFKLGLHGAAHTIGGMIAYVQEDSCAVWDGRICGWIKGIVSDGEAGWSHSDLLQMELDDTARRIAKLTSNHSRKAGMKPILLKHLWVRMP